MKLMVQLGDEILPLSQCFWIRANFSGCVFSSSHGDQHLTAEDAHKDFTPRQRDRDRETKQGWTVRLVTKQQWKELAEPCFMGACQHQAKDAA